MAGAAVAAVLLAFLFALFTGRRVQEPQGMERGAETGNKVPRLQVVATIFPQYDFARQIAGENAEVHMLLKPGEEVHSYEPTPRDIKMIQECDLFLYTGGENDVWVESILESIQKDPGADSPRAVRLLDLVDTFSEERLEGMMPEKGEHRHEEGEGAHAPEDAPESEEMHAPEDALESEEMHSPEDALESEEEPDEHVWTSPENCAEIIGKLTEAFCALDPARADIYRTNGDSYRAAFEDLDAEYREMTSAAPRRTILFGDRFPFRYLAEEFGLTCYAAFSGCSAESEPSAATVAFLIDKTVNEKIPAVFKIEFSNGNIARAIAEAAQAERRRQAKQADPSAASEKQEIRVLQLHSCHNVTRDEFAAGVTCLSLMRRNLEALRTALQVP